MSINKYSSSGFGASGAASSSWSGPRDSYKPQTVDHGTSFLMGGGGLRGRPNAPKDTESSTGAKAETSFSESRDLDKESKKTPPLISRGAIVSGASVLRAGDRSSHFSEQYGVFITIGVLALAAAFVIRWFSLESEDIDWVEERRSVVRQHYSE